VAAGSRQLDPLFINADVASRSRMQDGVVVTSLAYVGDVDEGIISDAEENWTGGGSDISVSLIRQSGGLQISMLDTPAIAARLGFCNCANAYWVAGHTDLGNREIMLNKDRSRGVIVGALTHELGHYFFGEGHPKVRGNLGFGGI